MKKDLREVEALVQIIDEYAQVQKNIANLPCGYISVKQISGHTYCYRQWREGKKIISQYVPDALLSSVKRKIAVRKENEALQLLLKNSQQLKNNRNNNVISRLYDLKKEGSACRQALFF